MQSTGPTAEPRLFPRPSEKVPTIWVSSWLCVRCGSLTELPESSRERQARSGRRRRQPGPARPLRDAQKGAALEAPAWAGQRRVLHLLQDEAVEQPLGSRQNDASPGRSLGRGVVESTADAARLHCCGRAVLVISRHIMEGRTDSLVMTVHLLAKSGHALLLQQTLDQLQEWICLDLRLFLVSERASPMKYYETYRQKSSRFPGTSVLLFLHEDFGEERIFQIHGFFQHPPWQRVHIENAKKGRLSPHALDHQDFYGLDEHMPVWGLRQVHYGTEILRVTLYCSFDNYDDAVRLYEMILRREAAVQKRSFCAFILYATQSIAVQLCLKQLPLGVCVDSKESSVLQFKVHKIGQLVPLLPHPCVPISSTRWQTEDYEGNRILLQVQDSSKHSGNQGSSSSCHKNAHENSVPLSHSSPIPLAATRPAVQPKTRTLRAMKNKNKSTRRVACTLGSLCSPLQSNVCSLSQSHSPARSSLQDLGSSRVNLGTKWRYSSHELWLRREEEEEETNVDTGNRVASSECSDSPLNNFSKDLQNGLLQSQASCCSFKGAGSRNSLHSEDRNAQLPHIAKRNTGSGQRQSGFHLGTSGASHGEEEEEEEFFI